MRPMTHLLLVLEPSAMSKSPSLVGLSVSLFVDSYDG